MNMISYQKVRNILLVVISLSLVLSGCSTKEKLVQKPSLRVEKATCQISTVQISEPTMSGTVYTLNMNKDCLLPGKWLAYYSMYGGRGNGFYGYHEVSLIGNTITIPEMKYGYGQTSIDFIFFPHSFQVQTMKSIYYEAGTHYKISTSPSRSVAPACKIDDVKVSDATSKGTDFTLGINKDCLLPGKWLIQYDLGFTTKYAHLIGQKEVSIVNNVIHVSELKYSGNAYAYIEILFFPKSNQAQSTKFVLYNS